MLIPNPIDATHQMLSVTSYDVINSDKSRLNWHFPDKNTDFLCLTVIFLENYGGSGNNFDEMFPNSIWNIIVKKLSL